MNSNKKMSLHEEEKLKRENREDFKKAVEYVSEMHDDKRNEDMTLRDWLITLVVMLVPFINIVMLFVWAFSKNENKNKENWAKASLIIMVVPIAVFFLFLILAVGSAGFFAFLGA